MKIIVKGSLMLKPEQRKELRAELEEMARRGTVFLDARFNGEPIIVLEHGETIAPPIDIVKPLLPSEIVKDAGNFCMWLVPLNGKEHFVEGWYPCKVGTMSLKRLFRGSHGDAEEPLEWENYGKTWLAYNRPPKGGV